MKLIATLLLSLIFTLQSSAQGTPQISLAAADSLFAKAQWEKARSVYEVLVQDQPEKINALTWNRLGFCYHHLGNFHEALGCYRKAMAAKPSSQLKPYLTSRVARAYSMLQDANNAFAWLDSAARAGYSNLKELDTLADYNPIRSDPRFAVFYKSAYSANYPCSANPRNREFDFWIGEWNVFQTGTTTPVVGHSLIQNASGGCMILENWTSLSNPYEGKSINFFDPLTKAWQQVWMGSGADLIRFYHGEYKDGAMRFTFEPAPVNGKKPAGRLTFFNQGIDQVRQLSEQSIDQGKTWTANYDLTYVRKK